MSSLLNHQLNSLGTEYESTSKLVPNTQFELRGLKGGFVMETTSLIISFRSYVIQFEVNTI